MRSITVVIADDHPVFRSGLESILQNDDRVQLLGSGSNGVESLVLVRSLKPDVLLLDMSMPEMDGLDVARSLFQSDAVVRILPLSAHTDTEFVLGALEAGVRGYILKDEKPSTIIRAILHVANGGIFISDRILNQHESNSHGTIKSRRERTAALLSDLAITPRLLEVLVEAAQGYSNREIGDRLSKSPHTVRNQIEALKSISGVTSRPALVAWAWRNGLSHPQI